LGAQHWYYAKILRKKATIISLTIAQYFYALSENFGSPDEDYLIQYLQGRMTQEAKAVYEALLNEGPLDTITLSRQARLSSRENSSRFTRALNDLQADFKILPVGISQAGGWRYAYIYDLVPRHFPELLKQARQIQEGEARSKLAHLYLLSVGATQPNDLIKLFRWSSQQVESALQSLVDSGIVIRGPEVTEMPGEWIAIPELL
jgi:predicted transcriptional regulator